MSGGLSRTDRRLLLISAAVAVPLLIATALLQEPAATTRSLLPSTYASQPGGARAAFLLLNQLGYPVERLEQPFTRLPASGRGTVLILAEPSEQPTEAERTAIAQFLKTGGRVLYCGRGAEGFLPGAPEAAIDWQMQPTSYRAALPGPFTAGAPVIELQSRARMQSGTHPIAVLYGPQNLPAAAMWRFGQGEVLWWAAATPLTNDALRRASNLRLFLNVMAPAAGSALPRILWDEYHHGQHGSLWEYVARSPMRWLVWQCLFAAFISLLAFSRRWGPIVPPTVESRLSPLEFVETLGGLYERAGAASIGVDTAYRQLRLQLTQQLALPANVADELLAEAAAQRLGWTQSEFIAALRHAAEARHIEHLAPTEALRLVQQLEEFSHRLDARTKLVREPR